MGFSAGDIIDCACGVCNIKNATIISKHVDNYGEFYKVEHKGRITEIHARNAMAASMQYKVGDTVWLNGSRRTIDDYDPILDLYQLNGGTWIHSSSISGTCPVTTKPEHKPGASPWAQGLPAQLEFETAAEQQSPTGGPRCECGVEAVGSGLHSSWCPKYERF